MIFGFKSYYAYICVKHIIPKSKKLKLADLYYRKKYPRIEQYLKMWNKKLETQPNIAKLFQKVEERIGTLKKLLIYWSLYFWKGFNDFFNIVADNHLIYDRFSKEYENFALVLSVDIKTLKNFKNDNKKSWKEILIGVDKLPDFVYIDITDFTFICLSSITNNLDIRRCDDVNDMFLQEKMVKAREELGKFLITKEIKSFTKKLMED